MSASDVIDALIKSEPAVAVEAFQSLVRERAKSVVAALVETREHPELIDTTPTDADEEEPQFHPVDQAAPNMAPTPVKTGLTAIDDDENNADIIRNAPSTVANESAHWEAGAVKPSRRGVFTKKADAAGESVHEYAERERGAPGKLGKEARLALTFEKQAKDR